MTEANKQEREERALDALIVSALRAAEMNDADSDVGDLPALTEEDKAALKSLGSDFITRLTQGQIKASEPPVKEDSEGELIAAGETSFSFMNRAEAVDQETEEELERKRQEIIERKRREQRDKDGSDA